jgi:hypothetical protein
MATFTKIASVTVGSGGAASIDFTSIPATYTDLVIKASLRNSASYRQVIIKYNNSSADFTLRNILGDGSAANSYTYAAFGFNLIGYAPLAGTDTASTFGNLEAYFPNYAGSTNKSTSFDAVSENNGTTAYALLQAGLWSQTAAINQLTLLPFGAVNFVQYSTATLYGIKNS